MSDYLAYLANCPLRGIEFTDVTKDGKPWRFRNLTRLNVAGFGLELHLRTDLPANLFDLVGQCIHTTNLFVRNVGPGDVPRLRKVIGYACELLSFATESRVLPYGFEYPLGSFGGKTAMVGTVQGLRPPFWQPEHVKGFVELCFDNYVKLRDPRKLHVVIDYIHHSIMSGLASEAHLAIACIAFENFRFNWALIAGYPFLDGFFREKGATAAKPGSVVGIARHLTEMFAEVGMNSDPKRIVDTRNEVIHTGLFGNVHNNTTYEFMETALREYFLRVVGYKGEFLPYIGGSPAPHII